MHSLGRWWRVPPAAYPLQSCIQVCMYGECTHCRYAALQRASGPFSLGLSGLSLGQVLPALLSLLSLLTMISLNSLPRPFLHTPIPGHLHMTAWLCTAHERGTLWVSVSPGKPLGTHLMNLRMGYTWVWTSWGTMNIVGGSSTLKVSILQELVRMMLVGPLKSGQLVLILLWA